MATLGTFTQMTGDAPGENIGDTGYESLTGVWYLDGAADADSIIVISTAGTWSLEERPGGDGDPTEVDRGTLAVNPDGEGLYYASSALFDDVVYDMIVADYDVMYWGGEYDCYQRVA